MENILPTNIIDLLEKKSFSDLTAVESQLVLKNMSQAEYESLYAVYQASKHYFHQESTDLPSEEISLKLNAVFAQKQAQKENNLLTYKIPFWKAAAILLVGWLCGAWMLSGKQTQQKDVVYVPVHDTVSQLITHIDTVIEYVQEGVSTLSEPLKHKQKEVIQPKKYIITTPKPEDFYAQISQETLAFQPSPIQQELYRTRPEDIDNPSNKQKGKSRGEDSLSKRFGFVSM